MNCSMQEANFEDADLADCVFGHCNLLNAVFVNSNLEKADFRTALHFNIDPEANKIKGAKFSPDGLIGLLGKYGIKVEE